MSSKENDLWLEGANGNFEDAILRGDYEYAKEVIDDTRDRGFEQEAEQMEKILFNTPLDNFTK